MSKFESEESFMDSLDNGEYFVDAFGEFPVSERLLDEGLDVVNHFGMKNKEYELADYLGCDPEDL